LWRPLLIAKCRFIVDWPWCQSAIGNKSAIGNPQWTAQSAIRSLQSAIDEALDRGTDTGGNPL
jgi:hypothetical protein